MVRLFVSVQRKKLQSEGAKGEGEEADEDEIAGGAPIDEGGVKVRACCDCGGAFPNPGMA